jgi:hypothetical protein
MSKNGFEAGDIFLPIKEDGPLPNTVPDLNVIPPSRRDRYNETADGTYRLHNISSDDLLNFTANLDAISAGKVQVFPPGETKASMAKAEDARRAQSVDIMRQVDEWTTAELKKQNDYRQAQLDKKKAALQADFDRRAQGYARSAPTKNDQHQG